MRRRNSLERQVRFDPEIYASTDLLGEHCANAPSDARGRRGCGAMVDVFVLDPARRSGGSVPRA